MLLLHNFNERENARTMPSRFHIVDEQLSLSACWIVDPLSCLTLEVHNGSYYSYRSLVVSGFRLLRSNGGSASYHDRSADTAMSGRKVEGNFVMHEQVLHLQGPVAPNDAIFHVASSASLAPASSLHAPETWQI